MSSLYPHYMLVGEGYPSSDELAPLTVSDTVGMGVRTARPYDRGTVVARFTGLLSHHITQHSLQVTPQLHIHDPWFVGLLTHSCLPNAILDMQQLEVIALREVAAGELLTIDYAVTEDVLYRQFPCSCGAPNCRGWITGRREVVSEEGRAWLESLDATLYAVSA